MPDRVEQLKEWFAELRRRKVVRVAVIYSIVAWLLIQVAGGTFGPLGLPAWSTRLVIVLAALGFPLAVALAWAFDVGTHGVTRTGRSDAVASGPSDAAGSSSARPRDDAERSVARETGSTAATADPSSASPRSVAILPFVDMSAERDQDYFCDGIAEEIINALCCVRGLKVASRTSAFQYKGRSDDVRGIGRALGVGSVLEGSVRKVGNRVRITAQLVNAADGYHLWSETFDRRLEDVFAIQSDIAQQITRTLSTSLTGREATRLERGGTSNSDAYEYYLRGRALLRQHSDTSRLNSKQMFERAIDIDPGFALGYAGLALSLADRVFWNQTKNPQDIADAMRAVARAEQLQAGLPEVAIARGQLLSAQGRRDEASAAFEEAIELAPNLPDIYYWYGRHAYSSGDHAHAARLFERTVELDPTNYTASGLLGSSLEILGDAAGSRRALERCAETIDRQLDLYPDDARAMQFGASTNATLGRRERALQLIEGALALRPDAPGTLYNVACAYARLGETDEALGLLEKWTALGVGSLGWIREDPDLDSLRGHPRFEALVAQLKSRGAEISSA